MKIRIVYDYTVSPFTSRIEDADTGEVVKGVRAIKFEHLPHEFPTITLEILKSAAVEIVAEGELVREDVSEVGDRFARMRLVPKKENTP